MAVLEWINRPVSKPELVDVVVLLSGGIDSAVTAGLAMQELVPPDFHDESHHRVMGLFIDYGQKSLEAEAVAACHTAAGWDLAVKYLKLDFSAVTKSSLFGDGEVTDQESTFVPGRNIIFLSYAASVAHSYGANYVATGIAPGSGQIYPDTTQEFAKAIQKALAVGLGHPPTGWGWSNSGRPKLYTPLLEVPDKLEICRMAHGMGIEFHRTVSCYNARVISLGKGRLRSDWIVPCGKCSPCNVRAWCRESLPYDFTNRDVIMASRRG